MVRTDFTTGSRHSKAGPQSRIIVSSGPSDRAAADRITAAARGVAGPDAGRIIEFGEFDLSELPALIGRSRLFGRRGHRPLHIAATTSTPVVELYGPTLRRARRVARPGDPDDLTGIEGAVPSMRAARM